MNWRFRCKKCHTIIEMCERADYVYDNGSINITHCESTVEIITKGQPLRLSH